MKTNHWLSNPTKETVLILLPLFLPVAIVILFQDYFQTNTEVTSWWWLVLVLLIDVGHVYSTLFRFYWEKATFQQYKTLLVLIPVCALAVGVALHLYDAFLFWRILAYIALYHFIRQQYGFVRLYSRKEKQPKWMRWLDASVIYAATLYPVLYWHLNLTESLAWFVPNDFVSLDGKLSHEPFLIGYIALLLIYVGKETWISIQAKSFNIPKNGIVIGTCLSWYIGIVLFRGDLTFTLLNVVSHGIPYMGLIWLYGEKKGDNVFSPGFKGVAIFILVLAILAYTEEFFWDVFIWKDHPNIFPFLADDNPITSNILLSLVVPLLVLPQVTHYVLDGFIWRFSKDVRARLD
jgi:hypothetical protein